MDVKGRILLLVGQRENRRLLAEWLSIHHEVVLPDSPAVLEQPFDVGIIDGPALEQLGTWVQAVKQTQQPIFLPFLLVTHQRDAGLATQHLWQSVDDLIITPTVKGELHARVQTLLRARQLSLRNAALTQQLEEELARAGRVQAELLPREAPHLPGFELAARCIPAREVGGDFYDWQQVTRSVLRLQVGDVMGKGMPAALLMATVRATLRAVVQQYAPAAALELARAALEADLQHTGQFVTLFMARLSASDRYLQYVDAGHGCAFVRRADGAPEAILPGGRPLGIPNAQPYQQGHVRFQPGDALVIYSDGLLDAHPNPDADAETLCRELKDTTTAEQMVQRLLAATSRANPPPDDLTVVVLRCTG